MGFFDIFRPKIRHSDYRVRLTAVQEIDDQAILYKTYQNDSNVKVRKAIVKKIQDS